MPIQARAGCSHALLGRQTRDPFDDEEVALLEATAPVGIALETRACTSDLVHAEKLSAVVSWPRAGHEINNP